jgi:tRNA dimethylallyltransferase
MGRSCNMDKELFIIVGPTAVGKTEIALALAEETGAEIISADSMQVYRGMDIGTAKPTPDERARVPHHLIDVADPKEEFSAGRFVQLADEAIEDITRRGKIPLVVGGTGMYIRALTEGLFEGPGADFALREELMDAERKEPGALYNILKNTDPKAAEKIHPLDIRRTIRALEVFQKSGKPISESQSQWGAKGSDRGSDRGADRRGRYDCKIAGLTMPRPELYRRIDERVEKMFKIGLLGEVKALRDKGCTREMPSMHALGYKQLLAHLDGELGLDEAARLIKRDTRHYAKRQYTWFNGQEGVQWVDISDKNLASSMDSVKKALDISGDFR